MATVVYDGGCGFCNDFRRFIGMLDWHGRFDWIDLHEADYDNLPVTEEECVEAMQVIDDGHVFSGFYATRRIFLYTPLLLPVALFMYVPGVPWIGRTVYRKVAERRHCTVPQS